MDRIINAARTFVPAERQDEFLAMVEGRPAGKKPDAIDQVAESVHQTAEKAIREFTRPLMWTRRMKFENDKVASASRLSGPVPGQ